MNHTHEISDVIEFLHDQHIYNIQLNSDFGRTKDDDTLNGNRFDSKLMPIMHCNTYDNIVTEILDDRNINNNQLNNNFGYKNAVHIHNVNSN